MLWIALLVNAAMFLVEITAGIASGSLSLLADAIDFAGDANMRSVWLCSRNDAIGNVGVLLAALMATLALHGGWQVWRQAHGELKGIVPL